MRCTYTASTDMFCALLLDTQPHIKGAWRQWITYRFVDRYTCVQLSILSDGTVRWRWARRRCTWRRPSEHRPSTSETCYQ